MKLKDHVHLSLFPGFHPPGSLVKVENRLLFLSLFLDIVYTIVFSRSYLFYTKQFDLRQVFFNLTRIASTDIILSK